MAVEDNWRSLRSTRRDRCLFHDRLAGMRIRRSFGRNQPKQEPVSGPPDASSVIAYVLHRLASKPPPADVVLILGFKAIAAAREFAEAFPDSRIHVLSIRGKEAADIESLPANAIFRHVGSVQARVDYLAGIPRPQLIIERWPKRKQQSFSDLRHLYWLLPEGGVYVLEGFDSDRDWLADRAGESVFDLLARLAPFTGPGQPAVENPSKEDRDLFASIEDLDIGDDVAALTKRNEHLVKLRDGNANEILDLRLGSAWGELITTRAGYKYVSRARVTSYGPGPIDTEPQTITVPDLHLRRYDDVTCHPNQIVEREGYFLPDSFRHPLQRRLRNHTLMGSGKFLDRHPDRHLLRPERRLDGGYFFLDTEFPGHFGHVVTEVVSRYWGWQEALARGHDVRPLLGLAGEATSMPTFQRQIFDQLGIPTDDVEYIGPNECVQVESLFAASPAFAMPKYVDAGLEDTWNLIGAHRRSEPAETPARVFVSRRPTPQRSCTNTAEVEEFFRSQGFAILYPEDLDYWSQVEIFAGAKIIAGFGGSGLFNIMHAPGAKVIIIAGHSYTAANELLIASVRGNDLHYFWGESTVQHPEGQWNRSAFVSNFSFELDRHRASLTELIDQG